MKQYIDYKIKNAAIKLWALAWAVICPHTNCYHFEKLEKEYNIDYNTWINGDLELLSRCDAIFMLNNYETSMGSIREMEQAAERIRKALPK